MFIMKKPIKVAEELDPNWKIGAKNFELLESVLEECIEEGTIRIENAEAGAFMIWSFMHGVVSLVIMERCQMMFEENLEFVMTQAHLTTQRMIGLHSI
jgi:hypothetical protein